MGDEELTGRVMDLALYGHWAVYAFYAAAGLVALPALSWWWARRLRASRRARRAAAAFALAVGAAGLAWWYVSVEAVRRGMAQEFIAAARGDGLALVRETRPEYREGRRIVCLVVPDRSADGRVLIRLERTLHVTDGEAERLKSLLAGAGARRVYLLDGLPADPAELGRRPDGTLDDAVAY